MRWVLLLRAVNVGGRNTLPMKDLTALLEELGHTDVRTFLNTGNATFESTQRSAKKIATDVEEGLRARGLDVRGCVRTPAQLQQALDELPDLPGYVTVTVLFDKPSPAALREFLAKDWSPEVVAGNDQVVYAGYERAGRTKLDVEKALGVAGTARTPATLAKLLRG